MRRAPLRAAGFVVASIAMARAAPAQTRSCQNSKADSSAAASQWTSPLDRIVTLHAAEISLRAALDRVAAAAKLKLSYTTELLPLDTAVCVDASGTPAGQVLRTLLRGTNVAATSVGGDQVVLVPRQQSAPAAAATAEPDMASTMGMLDRVVVTGTADGGPVRDLAVSVDVVDGKQLARDGGNTLSDALDSYVPGMWGWTQSPSSMLGSYASIRGASSLGLSYPKIYIDGIEVANPLLITHFNPSAVDHIEVIRGPQGSALYGVDAISGVVNIVTRQEGAPADGSHALLRVSGGASQSAFARGVMTQDHAFSVATGSDTRSADFNVAGGSIGSFVSNGYSRDLMAAASARLVGQQSSLTSTARFFTETAGTPNNPLFPRVTLAPPSESQAGGSGGHSYDRSNASKLLVDSTTTTSTAPQSVSEYTLGTTATFAPEGRWTHSVVAGIDGYSLSNVQSNVEPIMSAADKALSAAEGDAARATLRASSVLHLRADDPTRLTLTFSAERAALRMSEASPLGQTLGVDRQSYLAPMASMQSYAPSDVTWQNSAGFTTQANAALANTLFLTGGVRLESDSRFTSAAGFETMPMIGGAFVEDYGPVTFKLRGSYGKGIRPPTTPSRSEFWQTNTASLQKPLLPEEQSGTEAGLDIYFRRAFSLQVTRFDQVASNLIQDVAVGGDTAHRMAYIAQNVGDVSNHGWELQSSANLARLTATGALTFVTSRVDRLTSGYIGDLRAGDRMLDVPATTASLAFHWTGDRWYASLGGSQALNWVNYDEAAIAQAFAANPESRDFVGARLRQYWRDYTGHPRLRATASHDIRDMFAVDLSIDNLLNYQTGEPDNVTIVPGRTITSGIRWKF